MTGRQVVTVERNYQSSKTGSVERTYVDKIGERVSVKDFGATGDGTTDDTAAIQAAVDAMTTVKGEVEVPPGTYVATRLEIKANVTLQGKGGVLKWKDNTCTDAGTAYYLLTNENGSYHANVKLRNLIIDGNAANNATFDVADVITIGGENCEVVDCHVFDPPDSGIMFSDAKNGRVVGNRIDNASDVGIYVNDGDGTDHYENIIADNRVTDCNHGGIALKRITQRTIVADNQIYNCGNGITLENGETPGSTDYSTNVTIANNRMRYIGYIEPTTARTGIILRGSNHVVCVGNRIEDVEKTGIRVEGTKYSVIANNVVSFEGTAVTGGAGLWLSARSDGVTDTATEDCVVSGNVITSAPDDGIWLDGTLSISCARITLDANVVVNATGSALRIDAEFDDISLTGNILDGANDVQIFAGATGIRTANNHLVNGSISGTWADVYGKDGSVYIGKEEDSYFQRLAADIIQGPQYRSRSSVSAFFGGTAHTVIGNLGNGNGKGGLGTAPSGSSAVDTQLFRNGVGEWKTNGALTIGTTLNLAVYTNATRPAAGTAGRVIYNSDDGQLNIDNGTNWTLPDGTVT